MARIEYSQLDATVTGTQQNDNISALAFAGSDGGIEFTAGRNDTLFGLGGNDTMFAGDDQDRLFGGSGNDTLQGGRGNDKLFGGIGNDTLDGGDGNDTISVEVNFPDVVANEGFGTDTIIGGAGFDTINFQTAFVTLQFLSDPATRIENAGQGVSVNLVNSFRPGVVGDFSLTASTDGSVSAVVTQERGRIHDANGSGLFSDIEQFDLTSHGDFFLDSVAGHILNGGGGDDFISGGAGADVIDGGSGIDTALYRSSTAGVSISLLDLGSGGSGAFGEANGDKLFAIENVHGSNHNDFMLGDANANTFRGFAGNDTLIGGYGIDILFGGENDDTLRGGLGNDTVDGGAGSDIAQFTDWNGFIANPLSRVTGNITIGEGSFAGSATVSRTTFLSFKSSVVTSVLETDTLRGIEHVVASNFAETIIGNSFANKLEGRGGNDTIDGGRGSDSLVGGDGIDTVVFARSNALERLQIDASLSSGEASVTRTQLLGLSTTVSTETDTLSGIENLTGNSGSDRLIGDGLANKLDGGAGNDRLAGLGGGDRISGGDGIDTADYSGSDAGVTVELSTGTATGGHATGDTLSSVENVSGSSHGDRLSGTSGANMLVGADGGDTLEGKAGADVLDGGQGFDIADYRNEGTVDIDLASGSAGGAAEGDLLVSIEGVLAGAAGSTIKGDGADNTFAVSGGTNILQGRGGNDTLSGGEGRDQIAGGALNDTLTGGSGIDVFTFTANSGQDTITDFEDGTDRIRFNAVADASFADLAIAGNDTDHAIVIFGNSVIDILSTQALTLTAQDFLFT